jgi:hypothetical protein
MARYRHRRQGRGIFLTTMSFPYLLLALLVTGMAEKIDKILDDTDANGGLAASGSTDVAALFRNEACNDAHDPTEQALEAGKPEDQWHDGETHSSHSKRKLRALARYHVDDRDVSELWQLILRRTRGYRRLLLKRAAVA